jgi:CheY-like chemotaxis protein
MTEQGSLKVLIVEDESLVAMLIEDVLIDLGHEVVAIAGRLDQAAQYARELPIDLAIVDLNLNGQRTDPVAHILQERGLPFVFATGYGAAGVPDGMGDRPVLQKPFQPYELAAAIAKARR